MENSTPTPGASTLRVSPGDEAYEVLFRYWNTAGRPTQFLRDIQGYLALNDGDKLVFVKMGPPRGQEALYESISIKH